MNTRRVQCIGEHLRRERRIRDKTLEQVADAVGLKKNTISAYEKGKISIPIDNLDAVCQYLGIDYLDLLIEVHHIVQNANTAVLITDHAAMFVSTY